MRRKNVYFRKSFFKYIFPIFIVFIVGCTNRSEEIYNSAIQKGLDSLASENYDKAIVSFEIALEEKSEDKRAKALKLQTENFDNALKSFEDGDLEKASENAERAKKTENGSEALIKKSNDIIEEIKTIATIKKDYQKQYDNADTLFKDSNYPDSLEKITSLLQEDSIDQTYYSSIKKSSQELEKSINNEVDKVNLTETSELEEQAIDSEVEESSEDVLEAYNNLDEPLKALLAATIVDERAMSPELEGYYFSYNFDEEYLLTHITSGAGSGHPWFILQYDTTTLMPVGGVYIAGSSNYGDSPVVPITTSKIDLYKRYMESKNSYDIAAEKATKDPEMTMMFYRELRSLINE